MSVPSEQSPTPKRRRQPQFGQTILKAYGQAYDLRHLGLGPSFEDAAHKPAAAGPSLTAALAIYLKLKGHGRASHYEAAARRAVTYAVDALNDRPIDTYTQLDAARFRDALFARGLSSSSVKRMFGAVKAIVQLSIAEHGLACSNVFRGTFLPKKDDVRKRQPIPADTIVSVQAECQSMDDRPTLAYRLPIRYRHAFS